MKIYLSHAIRGIKGADATDEDMRKNCEATIELANKIRDSFTVDIGLYVPAESEDFVGIAYRDGYLNEQQILEIDCKIIDTCDLVICYVPEGDTLQGGRLIEVEHARASNKPCFVFKGGQEACSFITQHLLRGA